jgi:cbb3-type cytochrome oxidase cytochrome c subunit
LVSIEEEKFYPSNSGHYKPIPLKRIPPSRFKVGQQRVQDTWPSDHLHAPKLLLPQSRDPI